MNQDFILDKDEIKSLLSEISEKFRETIKDKLVELVLFGSYARGNPEQYSDVDIFVLIDDSDKNIKNYSNALDDFEHDLTLKYGVLVSTIMVNYKRFEEYKDVLPFYMNVEKEGVKIYERKAA
jgi:uncharacterized protein